jgi:superfamily I DNA/RNA helicase/mRNA-degrading endonuclease RelE of RelBE toxin-antitoxin system
MNEERINVIISSDCWQRINRFHAPIRVKCTDFLRKFLENPRSPGLNYEVIQHSVDPNIRSLRVDQSYRAIVSKPEEGQTFVLLRIDKHDDAYQFAQNTRCQVNQTSGTLQIYQTSVSMELRPDGQKRYESEGFLETSSDVHVLTLPLKDCDDQDLLRIGVPFELLSFAKSLSDEQDLQRSRAVFPKDAFDALVFLINGMTPDQYFMDLYGRIPEPGRVAAPYDFTGALDHPLTKSAFHVAVRDNRQTELIAMMEAPLEEWRVFLHPIQRFVTEQSFSGPARVTGGAGTGKTVVAMHRTKWLLENVCTERTNRILFTSFISNLVGDIEENLRKLCTPDQMRRVDVLHFDSWVSNYLSRGLKTFRIIYDTELDKVWDSAFQRASRSTSGCRFQLPFYREEWNQIILPGEFESLQSYLAASRPGRGSSLSRSARTDVWNVIETYRNIMEERRVRDIDSAMDHVRKTLLDREEIPYRAIIVDEAQDFSASALRLLHCMVGRNIPNGLFLAGDARQRIYRKHARLSSCGIDIRGRSRVLRINYRTTEENRTWALRVLSGLTFDDLDEGMDDNQGYCSLMNGPEPIIHVAKDFTSEIDYIITRLEELKEEYVRPEDICISLRTNRQVNLYMDELRNRDIPMYQVKGTRAEERAIKGVRIATMHRVKGLEFDHMILAGVDQGTIPNYAALESSADEAARLDIEKTERSLFYVAATRAKKTVLVTSSGKPSEYIRSSCS